MDGEPLGEVIVFTGGGKGKTTAALGLACRALGHGRRAAFFHFKGPVRPSLGDVRSARALGRRLKMIGIVSQAADTSFLDQYDETVPTVEAALDRAGQMLGSGEFDLLVLDDINPLLEEGDVDQAAVIRLITSRPESATLVFTGRSAIDAIVELADVVTDFEEVKHPARSGVGPRRGIEF